MTEGNDVFNWASLSKFHSYCLTIIYRSIGSTPQKFNIQGVFQKTKCGFTRRRWRCEDDVAKVTAVQKYKG